MLFYVNFQKGFLVFIARSKTRVKCFELAFLYLKNYGTYWKQVSIWSMSGEKKVENETQILKNEKDMEQIETERKRKKSLQKEINDLEKDEKISDFKWKNKISMIRNMSFKV